MGCRALIKITNEVIWNKTFIFPSSRAGISNWNGGDTGDKRTVNNSSRNEIFGRREGISWTLLRQREQHLQQAITRHRNNEKAGGCPSALAVPDDEVSRQILISTSTPPAWYQVKLRHSGHPLTTWAGWEGGEYKTSREANKQSEYVGVFLSSNNSLSY